jgi:hypothetical protein
MVPPNAVDTTEAGARLGEIARGVARCVVLSSAAPAAASAASPVAAPASLAAAVRRVFRALSARGGDGGDDVDNAPLPPHPPPPPKTVFSGSRDTPLIEFLDAWLSPEGLAATAFCMGCLCLVVACFVTMAYRRLGPFGVTSGLPLPCFVAWPRTPVSISEKN